MTEYTDTPASVESDEAVGRSALRKASWRLLPLIGLGYGIAYMDRINISFAALRMNDDLGVRTFLVRHESSRCRTTTDHALFCGSRRILIWLSGRSQVPFLHSDPVQTIKEATDCDR